MQINHLTATTQVFVGTTNPAKLQAVERVLAELAGVQIPVQGFSVPSGVSEQPRTDYETQKGSANRAKAVLKLARTKKLLKKSAVNLCIGLEGGVFSRGKELWCTVWASVTTKEYHSSEWSSFQTPPRNCYADSDWHRDGSGSG